MADARESAHAQKPQRRNTTACGLRTTNRALARNPLLRAAQTRAPRPSPYESAHGKKAAGAVRFDFESVRSLGGYFVSNCGMGVSSFSSRFLSHT